MKWDWKQWLYYAGIRAIKTFAQTFVSMIGVGAAFSEVDWKRALSVAGVALILSLLTSLAGIPEVEKVPETIEPPDEENENG